MQAHLTEEQIFESLLEPKDAAAQEHLAACAACSSELARLRQETSVLRDSARVQAEKPEAFWTRQRAAASVRSPQSSVRPLAWAATVAVALLAATLLHEPRPVAPATPPPDPDHALMVAVEQATRREVPQALAPAALLTQEISRNVKPTGPGRQSKGESR